MFRFVAVCSVKLAGRYTRNFAFLHQRGRRNGARMYLAPFHGLVHTISAPFFFFSESGRLGSPPSGPSLEMATGVPGVGSWSLECTRGK